MKMISFTRRQLNGALGLEFINDPSCFSLAKLLNTVFLFFAREGNFES